MVANVPALFSKALCQKEAIAKFDWPEKLLEEWMKFEREFGNLESTFTAFKTIRRYELQIQQRRQKEQQLFGTLTNEPDTTSAKPTAKRTAEDETKVEKKARKEVPAEPTAKQYRPTDPEKIPFTIFVSNLTENTTETKLCDFLMNSGTIKDVRLINDRRPGQEKTYAYVEFDSQESVTKALAMDRKPSSWSPDERPRPIFISRFKANREFDGDYSARNEKRTLYISNMPLDITSDILYEIFSQVEKSFFYCHY
jgi:RNA recognition motif-containing protein